MVVLAGDSDTKTRISFRHKQLFVETNVSASLRYSHLQSQRRNVQLRDLIYMMGGSRDQVLNKLMLCLHKYRQKKKTPCKRSDHGTMADQHADGLERHRGNSVHLQCLRHH